MRFPQILAYGRKDDTEFYLFQMDAKEFVVHEMCGRNWSFKDSVAAHQFLEKNVDEVKKSRGVIYG